MPRAHLPWTAPVPVRRASVHEAADLPPPGTWPLSVPAVAQLAAHGLDLDRATILVGANGSGKSTIVEAVATAYGMNPEGGSTGARNSTHATESPLHDWLTLERGVGASRWGYFLRAQTMHGLFTYLHDNPSASWEPQFHALSHGESFSAILDSNRFSGDGFFVMDEPEAGLSFEAQLHLIGTLMAALTRPGVQVLVATHSPVVASLPGALLLELDDSGIHEVEWEDLSIVDHLRRFLAGPERYLRHLRPDAVEDDP